MEAGGGPLRLVYMDPVELAENPSNWRTHPEAQIAALTDVIAEVGWAGACLYNERTGRLIDGHARRKVALEQGAARVPVLVGDWDEAAEKKILATLDPLAAMAEADSARLDTLLREVNTGSEALQAMLSELAVKSGVVPDVDPEGDLPDLSAADTHTITLRYRDEDEDDIKRFVGADASKPLDPIQTGGRILERIKEVASR